MRVSISKHKVDYEKPQLYWRDYDVLDWDELLPEIMCTSVWSGVIWRDGVRNRENFLEATWAVLDFDHPYPTLKEVQREICDQVHIIGITKSHQIAKKGVTCDRFRVALALERTIADARDYEETMRTLTEHHSCDTKCRDAARFFWPCKDIVSVNLAPDSFYEKVRVASPTRRAFSVFTPEWYKSQPLSPLIAEIIDRGLSYGDNRNDLCFTACLELIRKGYSDELIWRMIFSGVSRDHGFGEKEFTHILSSAKKFATRRR